MPPLCSALHPGGQLASPARCLFCPAALLPRYRCQIPRAPHDKRSDARTASYCTVTLVCCLYRLRVHASVRRNRKRYALIRRDGMDPFIFLSWCVGGAIGLCVLGVMTKA